MTSKFGGVPLSDPAPTAQTGSKFGGVALPQPANDQSFGAVPAAAKPEDKTWGEIAGDDMVNTMSSSFDKLKDDFVKSQGPNASPEALEKFKKEPLWERVKGVFDQKVAQGMLPFDAFNTIISPIMGFARGTVAHPIAAGLTSVGKPMRDFVRSKVPHPEKLPTEAQTQEGIEDDIMTLGGLALPFKSAGMAEKAVAEAAETGAPARSNFSHFINRPLTNPDEFAKRYAHRALTREGITKETAKEAIQKPGTALVDVGGHSMIEAGEQAALSGEGRRLGSKLFFDERLKGRRGRVADTVNQVANDKNMYEFLDGLDTERRTKAGPLYKEAFSGGSHAALKSQFEGEFAEASAAAHKARQEVADADSRITMTHAKHRDVGDNVYGNASRNQDLKAAADTKIAAERKAEQAEAQRTAALERLQTAQEHEATGVKGGLWSPRLQQFLDDPIMKPGISRGLEVQRLEALKDGEQFNPMEYGVKGVDANGEPIVSKVPNLRLLDAAKRGLQAMLEDYPRAPNGKLILDEKGRAIEGVRKELVKELDKLTAETNPAYKKAREAYSGPSGIIDSVHEGMDFHKSAPEELAKRMGGLSEQKRQGHTIGVVRNLADEASNPTSALRLAKNIVNDDYYQKQLRAVLGDEHFQHILDMAEREVSYAERGSQVLGGSQTQRRREGSKEFEQLGAEILDDVVTSAREGISGFAATPKRVAMRLGGEWIKRLYSGMSTARREALAKLLFSTDKEDNLRAIDMLFDEGTVTLPTGPSKKSFAPVVGAAVEGQDQPQQ